jgi:predicted Zn-dependent peptidase
VTAEDIRRAANRFLKPDRLVVLAVGDESKLDAPLDQFGEVVSLDVTIPEGDM